MNEQKDTRNSKSKMVDWFIDKVLAKAVIGLFVACIGLVVWQVKMDFKIEAQKIEITEIKTVMKQMRERMNRAMETGPGGHMTHREAKIDEDKIVRRLEKLEQ